jgi:hypothetical protein
MNVKGIYFVRNWAGLLQYFIRFKARWAIVNKFMDENRFDWFKKQRKEQNYGFIFQ